MSPALFGLRATPRCTFEVSVTLEDSGQPFVHAWGDPQMVATVGELAKYAGCRGIHSAFDRQCDGGPGMLERARQASEISV